MAGIVVGLAGAGAFILMSNDSSKGVDRGGYFSVGGLVGLSLALVSVGFAYRAARLGLTIEDESVVVRNLFHTVRLSRDDVVSVGMVRRRTGGAFFVQLSYGRGRRLKVHALEPALLRHNLRRSELLVLRAGEALGAPVTGV